MSIWKPDSAFDLRKVNDNDVLTCMTISADISNIRSVILYANISNFKINIHETFEIHVTGNGLSVSKTVCNEYPPMIMVGTSRGNWGEGKCHPFCGLMANCVVMPSRGLHVNCTCHRGHCNFVALYIPRHAAQDSVKICSVQLYSR